MGAVSDSETPWEPLLAGTEAEHLTGALGRLRATFRWKASGLDAAGLQTRLTRGAGHPRRDWSDYLLSSFINGIKHLPRSSAEWLLLPERTCLAAEV